MGHYRFVGGKTQAWLTRPLVQVGTDADFALSDPGHPPLREAPEYDNSQAVFVAKSGSDAGPGTREAPALTLIRAAELAKACSPPLPVVILDSGDYTERTKYLPDTLGTADLGGIDIAAAGGEAPSLGFPAAGRAGEGFRENGRRFRRQAGGAGLPAAVNQCAWWDGAAWAATPEGLYRSGDGFAWSRYAGIANNITGCCAYQGCLVFVDDTLKKVREARAGGALHDKKSFDDEEEIGGKCFAAGGLLAVNVSNAHILYLCSASAFIIRENGHGNTFGIDFYLERHTSAAYWFMGGPFKGKYCYHPLWADIEAEAWAAADRLLAAGLSGSQLAEGIDSVSIGIESDIQGGYNQNILSNCMGLCAEGGEAYAAGRDFITGDARLGKIGHDQNALDVLDMGILAPSLSGSAYDGEPPAPASFTLAIGAKTCILSIDTMLVMATSAWQSRSAGASNIRYIYTDMDGHTALLALGAPFSLYVQGSFCESFPAEIIGYFCFNGGIEVLLTSDPQSRVFFWDRRAFPDKFPASVAGCVMMGGAGLALGDISFAYSRVQGHAALTFASPQSNSRFEDIGLCTFTAGSHAAHCEFANAPVRLEGGACFADSTCARAENGTGITLAGAAEARRCIFAECGVDVRALGECTLYSCLIERGILPANPPLRYEADDLLEPPLEAVYWGSPLFASGAKRDFRLRSRAAGDSIDSGLLRAVQINGQDDMREPIGARRYSRVEDAEATTNEIDAVLLIDPTAAALSYAPANFSKAFSQAGGMYTSETNAKHYKRAYRLTWDKAAADEGTVQEQVENLLRIYSSPSSFEFGLAEKINGKWEWMQTPVRVRVDKSSPFAPEAQAPFWVPPRLPSKYEIALCEADEEVEKYGDM